MKLNVDASVRSNGGGYSLAGVLRNQRGEMIWCFAEACMGNIEVDVAEALALERGVELAISKGVDRVYIETDSQVLFYALQHEEVHLSYLGKVVENIKRTVEGRICVKFGWARRQANSVVHELTRFAFTVDNPFVSDFIPSCIAGLVSADASYIQ